MVNGFWNYSFTDGVVWHGSDPLVDNLFYYSTYHDIWAAGIDPSAHYHASGWHEGRDPNAFFSTSWYLSTNGDIAAAGIDPLNHYDQSGWHEGRNPSARFTNLYLARYADVAAAGVDPLTQYLTSGMNEADINSPTNATLSGGTIAGEFAYRHGGRHGNASDPDASDTLTYSLTDAAVGVSRSTPLRV